MTFVYDAGALIAAEAGKARMREIHAWATVLAPPLVPGPVLTQVWRGGPRAARMARLLKDCELLEGFPVATYKRAGRLLGAVSRPRDKAPDAVDALVVLTAAEREASAVVTSDHDDIAAYVEALGIEVEIVDV
jgi:hypothetical protein